VVNFVSLEVPPAPDWPLTSAFIKVENAAEFKRPGVPPPPNPLPEEEDLASSRVPDSCQPCSEPEKTRGRQSWPAATMEFSEVQVRETSGREGRRTL
jgi:hypothetical protein